MAPAQYLAVSSSKEAQPAKVTLSPLCLRFEDAPQRAHTERIGRMVKRERHAAAIGMRILTMASALPFQSEAIALKSRDDPASS